MTAPGRKRSSIPHDQHGAPSIHLSTPQTKRSGGDSDSRKDILSGAASNTVVRAAAELPVAARPAWRCKSEVNVEEEVGLKRPVDTGSPRYGMNRTRRPYPLNIRLRVTDFAQHILPLAVHAVPAIDRARQRPVQGREQQEQQGPRGRATEQYPGSCLSVVKAPD